MIDLISNMNPMVVVFLLLSFSAGAFVISILLHFLNYSNIEETQTCPACDGVGYTLHEGAADRWWVERCELCSGRGLISK